MAIPEGRQRKCLVWLRECLKSQAKRRAERRDKELRERSIACAKDQRSDGDPRGAARLTDLLNNDEDDDLEATRALAMGFGKARQDTAVAQALSVLYKQGPAADGGVAELGAVGKDIPGFVSCAGDFAV